MRIGNVASPGGATRMLAPTSPNARMNTTTHAASAPIRTCGKTILVMVRSQPAPATAAASSWDCGTDRIDAPRASTATGIRRARLATTSIARVPYTSPTMPDRFQTPISPMPTTVLGTAKSASDKPSIAIPASGVVRARQWPRPTVTMIAAVALITDTIRLLITASRDLHTTAAIAADRDASLTSAAIGTTSITTIATATATTATDFQWS